MGASENASQKRSEMQSLSLRCDVRAFKAANPGCELADFVRWHSPRDWIADADASAPSEFGGCMGPFEMPVCCVSGFALLLDGTRCVGQGIYSLRRKKRNGPVHVALSVWTKY